MDEQKSGNKVIAFFDLHTSAERWIKQQSSTPSRSTDSDMSLRHSCLYCQSATQTRRHCGLGGPRLLDQVGRLFKLLAKTRNGTCHRIFSALGEPIFGGLAD